jgi:arabinoxylan arabinofuranohydrolase
MRMPVSNHAVLHVSLMVGALWAAGHCDLAWCQKVVTPGYLFNSDPTCRELDGQFYLITSQDPFTVQFERPNEFYKGMYAYHVLTTTDFDNWTDHGSVVTGRDVTWNTGDALWDGDAALPANGKYYAFAPYRVNPASENNYGIFKIGVLTAENPLGPYKDALGGPMKTPDGKPLVGLSPWVVYGDDNQPYLIWGAGDTSQHWVKIARLKPGLTELAESPRDVEVPKMDACGQLDYFESPLPVKIGAKWYLTYVAYKDSPDISVINSKKDGAGQSCTIKGSYVDYVTSDSLFGPYNGPIRHLTLLAGDGDESVQQGICEYKGQRYLAYHLPYDSGLSDREGVKMTDSDTSTTPDHHRMVAVTKLDVLPDGTLRQIDPGRDEGVGNPGVTHLVLDAFAPRREAAEFHVRLNAWEEKGLLGEYQMQMGDGGYLLFRKVDFGGGAATFHVEVSSEYAGARDSSLEIRLDNPAGELIGETKVELTEGRTNYQTLRVPVSANAKGIHDLYLIARGRGAAGQGRLFNITSFGFTKR